MAVIIRLTAGHGHCDIYPMTKPVRCPLIGKPKTRIPNEFVPHAAAPAPLNRAPAAGCRTRAPPVLGRSQYGVALSWLIAGRK